MDSNGVQDPTVHDQMSTDTPMEEQVEKGKGKAQEPMMEEDDDEEESEEDEEVSFGKYNTYTSR
jgi:hypothetical protein